MEWLFKLNYRNFKMKKSNALIVNYESMLEALQIYLSEELTIDCKVTDFSFIVDGTFKIGFEVVDQTVTDSNGKLSNFDSDET